MNIIKVLIFKEAIIIKNNLVHYISILLIFPLLLYLFFSIPLSVVLTNMKPVYMVWSAVGIWMVSSLFFIYLINYMYSIRNYKSELMKSTPVTSYQYLVSSYIISISIGVLQFIIAMIITSSINSDYINFLNSFKILIISIPSMIVICNVAFIISILVSNIFFIYISHIIVFVCLSFGFGSFIPLSKFPQGYIDVIKYFPISSSILNVQRVIGNEPILFSLFFVSIFYIIIFSIIHYFIIEKNVLNNN